MVISGFDYFTLIDRLSCSEELCRLVVTEQLWPIFEDWFGDCGGYDQWCSLAEFRDQEKLDPLLARSSYQDLLFGYRSYFIVTNPAVQ